MGYAEMHKCVGFFLPSSRILSMEKGLCLATQHFTDDRARTGDTSGKTSDGKDYDDLMDMYGSAGGSIASIAKYGRTNARDIVVSILVSDGDPARKGRNILLDNKYSKVGISITHGQNAHNGSVMAIYLAERYISN